MKKSNIFAATVCAPVIGFLMIGFLLTAGESAPAKENSDYDQQEKALLEKIDQLMFPPGAPRTVPGPEAFAPHPGLIGLLELPDSLPQPCGPDQPVSFDLFAIPSSTDPPIGSLTLHSGTLNEEFPLCYVFGRIVQYLPGGEEELLPTRETNNDETKAAIVYERSDSWYRIALSRGSAWINWTNPDDFLSYPSLLRYRMTYFYGDWDGELWRAPDDGLSEPLPMAWQQYMENGGGWVVRILDERRVDNRLWVRVQIVDHSCGSMIDPPDDLPEASGWIPAYRQSDGKPSLWFVARGC